MGSEEPPGRTPRSALCESTAPDLQLAPPAHPRRCFGKAPGRRSPPLGEISWAAAQWGKRSRANALDGQATAIAVARMESAD
eukprot:11563187-Alexandrium_andersonii.AAC.1